MQNEKLAEAILGRKAVELDNDLIEQEIAGRVILVTGGGGSIGSEICRQILPYRPKRLLIFDIYENDAYLLDQELRGQYPETEIRVLIGSVRDEARLASVFSTYRPDVVFHAAAHKHVPLMEESPGEAIKNNVFGTYYTALCAEKYQVKKFVLISTDKAVHPVNVMGATKRICEMIVQLLSQRSQTEFSIVRFGNVFGSNGSVVPVLQKQIEAGGPVTVVHPDATRFFMTVQEAAQLVLQAMSFARGGEIFVLDMGEPVNIYEMAKKLICYYGYEPETEMPIEFIGQREGDKLCEELLTDHEMLKKTKHDKIFVGRPLALSDYDLEKMLSALKEICDESPEKVKSLLQAFIL